MSRHHVEVPAIVTAKARSAPGGQDWDARLPEVLAVLERTWDVTITEALPGGTASYIARACTSDGSPAVVKVAVPGSTFARQVRTLAKADGDGYARLLAHDAQHEAALLEALGPSLHEAGLPPRAQLEILARCLRRAWRVPPPTNGELWSDAVDKAAALNELITRLWMDLDRPCSAEVLEYAVACARRRSAAFDPKRCVLVHGDAAAPNCAQVLTPRAGTEQGFVLIDPDGFVADPAYDLGVALRDWCPQLLATRTPVDLLASYCQVVAEHTSIDSTAIWEWGYLERVSTGLYALSLGASDDAQLHLRSAQALLDHGAAAYEGPPRPSG